MNMRINTAGSGLGPPLPEVNTAPRAGRGSSTYRPTFPYLLPLDHITYLPTPVMVAIYSIYIKFSPRDVATN